jgi:hypothetical protein
MTRQMPRLQGGSRPLRQQLLLSVQRPQTFEDAEVQIRRAGGGVDHAHQIGVQAREALYGF